MQDRSRYHELPEGCIEKMRDEATNITPEYEQEYNEMFAAADQDGDGRLNCEEFIDFLHKRDAYN